MKLLKANGDTFVTMLLHSGPFSFIYYSFTSSSGENRNREALLICRYAGYRNYLEYRNVVEDDLDRMRKSNDVMGMMFNPLIMLDNLDCSKAGIHKS